MTDRQRWILDSLHLFGRTTAEVDASGGFESPSAAFDSYCGACAFASLLLFSHGQAPDKLRAAWQTECEQGDDYIEQACYQRGWQPCEKHSRSGSTPT